MAEALKNHTFDWSSVTIFFLRKNSQEIVDFQHHSVRSGGSLAEPPWRCKTQCNRDTQDSISQDLKRPVQCAEHVLKLKICVGCCARANQICVSLQFWAIGTTFLTKGLRASKSNLRFATVLTDRRNVLMKGLRDSK